MTSVSKWLTSFEFLKTGADCGRDRFGPMSMTLARGFSDMPEAGRTQPSDSSRAEGPLEVAEVGLADWGRAETGRAEAGRAEDGRAAGRAEDGLDGGRADGADAGRVDGLGFTGGLAEEGRGVTSAAFADAGRVGRAWL